MKDAFWFQHDSNARTDARILELRAEMGWQGYGLWWALVEKLREATDYQLSNTIIGGLAMDLALPKSEARAFLDICIVVGLLAVEGDCFYAPALRRRMERWDTKRSALSDAGRRGAGKRWAGEKPADSLNAATPIQPQWPSDSQAIATPLATPLAIREENIREENIREEDSTKQDVLPVAANAAASAPEKKIAASDLPTPASLPANPAQEAATGGATDVPTRKAAPRRKPGEMPDPPGFDVFWQAYPRKENRRAAVRAFAELAPESQATATAAVRQWFATRPDLHSSRGDFRPHPATWLNQTRFLDSTPQPVTHASAPNSTQPGNRYQTTRHANGFGSFAVRPPGDVARQPTGGAGPVGGPHPLPGAAG